MFSITLFNFRQRMPVIAIGKYGELGFGNYYIGDTNTIYRLMCFVNDASPRKCLLKHNLNRCVNVRLGLLFHSIGSYFSPSFITKPTMLAGFIKLCFACRCPYSSFMASGHKFFSAIRVSYAPLINSPTFNRTKLLTSFTGYILATLKAFVFRRIAPASLQIASPRAIIRCCLPAIKRIKDSATGEASLWCFGSVCCITHSFILPQLIEIVKKYCYTVVKIEEKYCHIAAQRCS